MLCVLPIEHMQHTLLCVLVSDAPYSSLQSPVRISAVRGGTSGGKVSLSSLAVDDVESLAVLKLEAPSDVEINVVTLSGLENEEVLDSSEDCAGGCEW